MASTMSEWRKIASVRRDQLLEFLATGKKTKTQLMEKLGYQIGGLNTALFSLRDRGLIGYNAEEVWLEGMLLQKHWKGVPQSMFVFLDGRLRSSSWSVYSKRRTTSE